MGGTPRDARVERDSASQRTRREEEASRRLRTIRTELERDHESIALLHGHFTAAKLAAEDVQGFPALHPQLLAGAWEASGPRLAELLEDVELTADLAVFYGRIEELRWRLRFRTEHLTTGLDEMTRKLVAELVKEVADLLDRVSREIARPNVIELPFIVSHAALYTPTTCPRVSR